MIGLLAIISHLMNVFRHDDGTFGVLAFGSTPILQNVRASDGARFAKKPKPRNSGSSSGAGFAKKKSEPTPKKASMETTVKEKPDFSHNLIFDTHFRDFVSKEDVGRLLSVCNEVQNSHIYRPPDWADSCKIDEQPQAGTRTVIATKHVNRGQILTLVPIHAIGLRNVRDSKDGVEYIEFNSEQDENTFKREHDDAIKLNIPLNPEEMAHPIIGKKPFIRLFIISLHLNEAVPGWLGGVIKTASDPEEANCVTLPLPCAAPFCAVVATKDIKEGDKVVQGIQPLEWSNIDELNDGMAKDIKEGDKVVQGIQPLEWSNIDELNDGMAKEQMINISMLRLQIQKAFLGPFHEINQQYPGLKKFHSDPDIYEIEDFLTADECDRIIADARPFLKPKLIYDEESGEFKQSVRRTSTEAPLPPTQASSVVHKITNLACCSAELIDGATVLNYQQGQEVKSHTDHVSVSELKQFRLGVTFCYLNDVSEGGTTFFSEIDLDLKPRKGTAVIHFPADVKGRPDERTLHQGSPAIDEKWILVITWSNVKQPKWGMYKR